MTGFEEMYLGLVFAAFALFATFVIRADKASEEHRKTH